jgi:DNA-binding XRE family transcriptional regulator
VATWPQAIINLCYTVSYGDFWELIHIMMDVKEQRQRLSELGTRLKTLRLARNDTMAVFAQRLGVSAGTLRAMEHGTTTVQIGAWVKALWVLDHLDDLNGVLAQKASLLEQARAPRTRIRQRASRRA